MQDSDIKSGRLEVEIIHGIIIANIFDHISDKLHVCGQFAMLHVMAQHIAQYSSKIFVPRIGQEASGVG